MRECVGTGVPVRAQVQARGRRGRCPALLGSRAVLGRGWVFQPVRKGPSGTPSPDWGIPDSRGYVTLTQMPKHSLVVFPNPRLISPEASE